MFSDESALCQNVVLSVIILDSFKEFENKGFVKIRRPKGYFWLLGIEDGYICLENCHV